MIAFQVIWCRNLPPPLDPPFVTEWTDERIVLPSSSVHNPITQSRWHLLYHYPSSSRPRPFCALDACRPIDPSVVSDIHPLLGAVYHCLYSGSPTLLTALSAALSAVLSIRSAAKPAANRPTSPVKPACIPDFTSL